MSSTITALTSGGGLAMAGDTSGQLELKTNNGTTAVTIDTSQNVNIGTSGITEKLVATGAIVSKGQLNNLNASTTVIDYNSGNIGRIIATGPDASTYPAIVFANTTTTTYAERMRITSTGDVGIGTATPTQSWTGGSAKVQQLQGGSSQITVLRVNESSGTYGDLQLISSGSAEIGVYNFANGAMRFGTNGTERMRIASGGDVLIGTSTPNAVDGSKLYVYYNGDNGIVSRVDSGNYCYVAHTGNGSNTGLAMSFRWTSTQVGRITTTSSATSYVTSSDYRLKEDVVPMTGALAKVALLKPVTYKWKVDGSDGEGFIAHELAEVCPQAVSGEKDAVDEKGDPDYQGIDTSFLVATLTAAIQELNAKVDAQAAEIQALKGVA